MTKEELDKKIAEDRKHSEILSQPDIDELLKAIEEGEEDFSPVRDHRKIKIYDFKRPDKFSRLELRDISNVSEIYAKELRRFLSTWNEGAGILAVDPALFYKGFLNSQLKKNHEPNGLEQKIFLNCIYKPFEIILHETFSDEVGSTLPEISDVKYECNPQFTSSVIWPTEMGVLITFVVKIEKTEAYMNLFFNADFFESLRKTNFFTASPGSKIISLPNPEPNTIVEAGRFRLEEGEVLKEKYIYELNHLAGTPLHVYKDGKYVGDGEAVAIDDNSGVRIVTNQDKLEERKELDFYNAKVIFGGRIMPDDYMFNEGCILELNEYTGDPIKIVKDEKLLGWGELVVVDENFAIKVLEVL